MISIFPLNALNKIIVLYIVLFLKTDAEERPNLLIKKERRCIISKLTRQRYSMEVDNKST